MNVGINESSLIAHARIAPHVVFVVLDNGSGETTVATVRSLYDTELFGPRSFEDRNSAMRYFVAMVSLVFVSKPKAFDDARQSLAQLCENGKTLSGFETLRDAASHSGWTFSRMPEPGPSRLMTVVRGEQRLSIQWDRDGQISEAVFTTGSPHGCPRRSLPEEGADLLEWAGVMLR